MEQLNLEGAVWRKSSYSGTNGDNCLEVTTHAAGVPVRDSKRPSGPVLHFPPTAWTAFLKATRA